MTTTETRIGAVLSVEIHRPGNAEMIAKNGWPCSHLKCRAKVTTEVRFTRKARCFSGYSVGSHGTCDAHAESHARALKQDYDAVEVETESDLSGATSQPQGAHCEAASQPRISPTLASRRSESLSHREAQ